MAKIELNDVSLTFTIRQQRRVTLKEYITRGLFLSSRNPKVAVHALSDLSFSATDGDRIGVIGHNGAGKSTLLKLLAGVYPPTRGKLKVEGRICSLFDIALGFEPDASGWENIKYRSYLLGETPTTLKGKIQEIADFSEIGDFLNIPVRYYSSGMLVRLAFSISTAIEPEVLLIDEVLGAGDMSFQLKARERMKDMMASARLMVLVTHEVATLEQICNRAIWLQHGRIMKIGHPDEVVAAYQRSMSNTTETHHVGGGLTDNEQGEDDTQAAPGVGASEVKAAA